MSGIDIVRTAIGNSLRSRLRTTLTVLAIFIGAFTLTITSAIGTGVSNYIDTQIGAFGAKDVLSITKTAKDAPPANAGPAAYDPDDAVTGGDLGDRSRTSRHCLNCIPVAPTQQWGRTTLGDLAAGAMEFRMSWRRLPAAGVGPGGCRIRAR
jgi:putative ABC transport system permease protein